MRIHHLFVALAAAGCATDLRGLEPASVDTLKTGQWGGQHVASTGRA